MKNKLKRMKRLITVVLLIVLSFTANATTYYFAASGNDANNGTSTSTPWKTLSKFNSVFSSRSPGDNFLFNRGDVFYGKIIISIGFRYKLRHNNKPASMIILIPYWLLYINYKYRNAWLLISIHVIASSFTVTEEFYPTNYF